MHINVYLKQNYKIERQGGQNYKGYKEYFFQERINVWCVSNIYEIKCGNIVT